MFGCIGRIAVLIVFVVLGSAAYATRGTWEPKVRATLGIRPAHVVAAPTWEPVTAAGATRARDAIAGLKRPTGPAFVNVKSGDLVAFALDTLLHGWGPATKGVTGTEALAGENQVSVRGTIHMKELGGAAALGPLAGMLEGDQPIEVRGRLEMVGPGRGQFKIERVALKDFVLPSAAIGPIVQRLLPRGNKELERGVLSFALPPEVADIRVTKGRITLYKAVR